MGLETGGSRRCSRARCSRYGISRRTSTARASRAARGWRRSRSRRAWKACRGRGRRSGAEFGSMVSIYTLPGHIPGERGASMLARSSPVSSRHSLSALRLYEGRTGQTYATDRAPCPGSRSSRVRPVEHPLAVGFLQGEVGDRRPTHRRRPEHDPRFPRPPVSGVSPRQSIGKRATTRTALNYTNDVRAVSLSASANVPNSNEPDLRLVENLDVRNARTTRTRSLSSCGTTHTHNTNAARRLGPRDGATT